MDQLAVPGPTGRLQASRSPFGFADRAAGTPADRPSSHEKQLPPAPPQPAPLKRGTRFILGGNRYLLGQGPDFYGIWGRGGSHEYPIRVFPLTAQDWERAWRDFCELEPRHSPVLGAVRSFFKGGRRG